ncbi:MAG TPA: hypothetical protein VM689_12470 [Aliidongia sp.]|nr:hypothetical protein [Aliidongia sp.]
MTRVYIWYPTIRDDAGGKLENLNIGHAAMHLGNDYDPKNSEFYVSWWPGGGFSFTSPQIVAEKAQPRHRRRFESDCIAEGAPPHVVYTLECEPYQNIAMNEAWKQIMYGKSKPSYHVYRKNCSSVVARVLKAGGMQWPMGNMDQLMKTKNVIWMPRDIAEWCDKLCALGKATKRKSKNCPEKWDKAPDQYYPRFQWSQFHWVLLGMR